MPVDLRPPSPFRGRGEVMEAAGGGKRNAIAETKHSMRAIGTIVAPRARSSSSGLLDTPRNGGATGSSAFPRVQGRKQAPRRCGPWTLAEASYLIHLYWYSEMRIGVEQGSAARGMRKYFCAGLTQNQGEHRFRGGWDDQRLLCCRVFHARLGPKGHWTS